TMSPACGSSGTRANSTHSMCPTTAYLTIWHLDTFELTMRTLPPADTIPPFERFYLEHRDEVLRYLRKLLGPRAEDAWQETFLRALRAYDRLEHARHLRAWVFTIATNVAMDELRPRASADLAQASEPRVELRRDAF